MNQSLFGNDYPRPVHQELYLNGEINAAQLALLMNEAGIDQIMALDKDLKIIAWSYACEQAMGIGREKAVGKHFTELAPRLMDYPHIVAALETALKGMKSFVPWENGGYNGGYFEHHFIPLKTEESVIGVLVIIHDVAHRIKAEEELKRLNHQLAQKARELQNKTAELARFNWIAAHDLKEPLRKIYTFIEMVATKEGIKLTDAARANLRRAQSAAQRMGLLTDDIATFTQVAAPNEELEQVDLEQVLQEILASYKRTIENEGAEISHTEMPVICAFPNMMRLLFSHLLGNALKFQQAGEAPKISISYSLVPGEQIRQESIEAGDNYHCICFRDNGIGIAPEYFEQIFGMFQRLHEQTAYKGTGMGLAICRKIAYAHEGFITVESELGKGATFCCYLKEL